MIKRWVLKMGRNTNSTSKTCHLCGGSGRIGGGRRPEYDCPACSKPAEDDLNKDYQTESGQTNDGDAPRLPLAMKKAISRSNGGN